MCKIININNYKLNQEKNFENKKKEINDFIERMSIDDDLTEFFDDINE